MVSSKIDMTSSKTSFVLRTGSASKALDTSRKEPKGKISYSGPGPIGRQGNGAVSDGPGPMGFPFSQRGSGP